ncbi:NAD dependent epimerase/dehydratase-like protein 1 [Elsinoe fawcettii]|nr:NAD dependent epimerase/dehydratase-like protein 1 [Elsinoe fawcettii]
MTIPGIKNPAIPYGSLVVITGCSGFIGSHVTDQVLAAGYKVRGTSRDSKKNAWLKDYFNNKHGGSKFELVDVKDLAKEGAFDEAVQGAQGFIHVAHDMGGSSDPKVAIPYSVDMAVSALKASAKAGLKRFVYTSSSFAVTQPKPSTRFTVSESTFNEEALQKVRETGDKTEGATVYAASKVEVERALNAWKKENNASIVINSINPNANLGPVLQPQHQGYPTTAGWTKNIWDGKYDQLKRVPEHFINVVDDAKLHVIALSNPDLSGRRLLGMVAPSPVSKIVEILRKAYPDRKFDDFEDDGKELCVNAEADKVEAILKDAYGHGYTSLEDSVKASVADLK